MPTPPTGRFGFVLDELADGPPDGPDVFLNQLAAPINTLGAMYSQGTFALRPVSTSGTPGKQGRFYMVVGDTDKSKNGILWYDYGTGWFPVAFASVELDSNIRDSPVSITATTEAGATTIVSGHSVPYDGGRVKIEAWVPRVAAGGSNSGDLYGVVYRDSVVLGHSLLGSQDNRGLDVQGNQSVVVFDPPSPAVAAPAAGNHVYSLRAYSVPDSGSISWTVVAGPGGSGEWFPATIRVFKA
jgi:hypothetical protein